MTDRGMKLALVTALTSGLTLAACIKTNHGKGKPKPGAESATPTPPRSDHAGSNQKVNPEAPRKYAPLTGAVNNDQILNWVQADKARRGSDARYYRYAYIPASFLKDPKEANYARIGLSKAINSVAIYADDIVSPQDVSEGHGVVFALDLRAYWGAKAEQNWAIAAGAVEKDVFSPAPRLDLKKFDANQPVSADQLAYNLLHGAIYDQLIETPDHGQELIENLGASQVTAHSAVKNAITYSPRLIQRRALPDRKGSYWESFDDFNGNTRELPWLTGNPIPTYRFDGMITDYDPVASEAWVHMKNGLPAYYIWGNANQERTKAELSFVLDPMNNKGNDLITGMSCIFCHISGVQSSPNDMATAVAAGLVKQDVEKARQYWTPNEEISKQYAEDRGIVLDALRKIVLGISDGDAKFNEDLINGADEHEPTLLLTSGVTGNPLRGDTHGRRRRDQNGNLDALE